MPVSWDLVCRKNIPFQGASDMTELAVETDKDLPIESIQVLPAAPDAADRYGRETRAWVAAAQAEKRAKADMGPRQDPVLPEAAKNQPMVAYTRTYLVPLMQNAAPQEGEVGAPSNYG